MDNCKYLGHIISCNLSDHADIERQIRRIYVNANVLKREFYSCKEQVKLLLFKLYCTSLYCSSLWCSFSKTEFSRIRVAYNNSLRILLGLPRWSSASEMFTKCDVLSFECNLRKYRCSLMRRLSESDNVLIKSVTSSNRVVTSDIARQKLLHAMYGFYFFSRTIHFCCCCRKVWDNELGFLEVDGE